MAEAEANSLGERHRAVVGALAELEPETPWIASTCSPPVAAKQAVPVQTRM